MSPGATGTSRVDSAVNSSVTTGAGSAVRARLSARGGAGVRAGASASGAVRGAVFVPVRRWPIGRKKKRGRRWQVLSHVADHPAPTRRCTAPPPHAECCWSLCLAGDCAAGAGGTCAYPDIDPASRAWRARCDAPWPAEPARRDRRWRQPPPAAPPGKLGRDAAPVEAHNAAQHIRARYAHAHDDGAQDRLAYPAHASAPRRQRAPGHPRWPRRDARPDRLSSMYVHVSDPQRMHMARPGISMRLWSASSASKRGPLHGRRPCPSGAGHGHAVQVQGAARVCRPRARLHRRART